MSDGLYDKYEVYENGAPVEDCFVLEPERDPLAQDVLLVYADLTEDEQLSQDLMDWVAEIRGGDDD